MKNMNVAFLFVLFTISAATLWFLSEKSSKNCLLLINSKYFDTTNGGFVANKAIVIQKEKISEILDSDNLQRVAVFRDQCTTVDLSGKFLIPGLIDSHTHLLALDGQRVSGWKDGMERSAARPNMTRLFIGQKNARSMLLAGFTTIRDLGNSGNFLDSELKSQSRRAPGHFPEIIISGPGIAVSPSQIDLRFNSAEYQIIKDFSEIDAILVAYKKKNVEWIKFYGDNSAKPVGIEKKLLRELVERARQSGFKVAIHAIFDETIGNAVNAEPDSIEHFDEIPSIELQPQVPRPYVVTTDFSVSTCERIPLNENCPAKLEVLRKRIGWLKQNNFRLVFGADSMLDFSSNFKSRGEASLASLINLGKMGLTPAEALTAATKTAAEMLGIKTGSIRADYTADLVALEENPLQDLNHLKSRSLIVSRGHIVCKNLIECRL